MPFDVSPPVTEAETKAVRAALTRAGVDLAPTPGGGAWRRAGAREAVGLPDVERPADLDAGPAADSPQPYARSPRSTRGATRA